MGAQAVSQAFGAGPGEGKDLAEASSDQNSQVGGPAEHTPPLQPG